MVIEELLPNGIELENEHNKSLTEKIKAELEG